MVKRNKLVSLVTVLAMIISMFSMFSMVNAAVKPEIKATVSESGSDTVDIKISYSGLEMTTLGTFTVQMKIPEGFTATKAELAGEMASVAAASPIISGNLVTIDANKSGLEFTVPSAGDFAVITATKSSDFSGTAEFTFEDVAIVDPDDNALELSDDAVDVVSGTYSVQGEVTGPRFYIEDVNVGSDYTADVVIKYADLPETMKTVGTVTVQVQLPDGFEAESVSLTGEMASAASASPIISGSLITIDANKSGISFDIPLSGEFATIKVKTSEGYSKSAVFAIVDAAVVDPDDNALEYDGGNGDLKVVNGKIADGTSTETPVPSDETPAPVTGPRFYIEDVVVGSDYTADVVIKYADLPETMKTVGTVTVQVQLPDGFEAESVSLTGEMASVASASPIISGSLITIDANKSGISFDIPLSGEFATIKVKTSEGYNKSAVFAIVDAAVVDPDDNALEYDGGNGDLKVVNGKIKGDEPGVSPSPTPTAEPGVSPSPTPTAEPGVSPSPTPSPADDKTNMNASEVPETVNVGGKPGSIKAFAANVAALDPAVRTAMKAKVEDGQTYKLVFDFKTAKGVAAGWGVVYLTADQLREILDDPTKANNYKVGFANADASKTETHFEYENGTVLTD